MAHVRVLQPTYVEANAASAGLPNWRVVGDGREVAWWSERDGWGHLYLYDAVTGEMKNRITEGPWMVVDLLQVLGEEPPDYTIVRPEG